MRTTARTVRYARTWLTGRAAAREATVQVEREDRSVPARLLLPSPGQGPYGTWILLHGVTRPGIDHPQLLRFARALASSGTAVLIPEVPEWKDLRLAPEATLATVAAAIRTLRETAEVKQVPFGLIGFSFGGPQALIAASHEAVAGDVAGVVSFGGYCDLERTLRFQFTGEHEWRGRVEHLRPDPYGRWVVGANYLTAAPGYGDADEVARALQELAAAAGEHRVPAWSPVYDGLKERLRAALPRSRRELFDVFAPASSRGVDGESAEALVKSLTAASASVSPLMEPTPFLGRVHHRVELLHGRGDRLIPYSESLRTGERLPAGKGARVTVTRLFAHSAEERFPLVRGASEVWLFFRALGRVLGTV